MEKEIILYHGGDRNDLERIMWNGPDQNRKFFCTPHRNLAVEASKVHQPFDGVLEIPLPTGIYQDCIENGHFIERPYCGVIQVEGAREVEIKPGEGVAAIDHALNKIRFRY